MFLKEWDFDNQCFAEVEYPDGIIKSLIDFLRNNNQWRDEPRLVGDRLHHFERELTDVRNERATLKALEDKPPPVRATCTGQTKAGEPCRSTIGVEDGLCAVHRRARVAA